MQTQSGLNLDPGLPDWRIVPSIALETAALRDLFEGSVGHINLSVPGFASIVRRVGDQVQFTIESEGFSQEQIFSVRLRNFEGNKFFQVTCPETGVACDILYIIDATFVSKNAYRRSGVRRRIRECYIRNRTTAALMGLPGSIKGYSTGLMQTLRLVGAGDNELAAWLLQQEDEKLVRRQTREHLAKERLQRKEARLEADAVNSRQARARVAEDPLGTLAGLNAATKASKGFRRPLAASPSALEEVSPGKDRVPALPPRLARKAVEDFPRLDMRDLRRQGLLVEGALTLVDLYWPGCTSGIDRVTVAIDLRGPDPQMRLAFDYKSQPCFQVIWLNLKSINGRVRPTLLCASTGEPLEVVVFREGRFARPKLLTLLYRKQLPSESARNCSPKKVS